MTEIVIKDGVRLLIGTCPHGRRVVHGGGRTTQPLSGYLGERSSHVPCCRKYVLFLS